MSDNRDELPFAKRSNAVESSVSSIAVDAQKWVREAAGDTAGLTVCRQIRNASRNLGYGDFSWRVRAAWNGEAETWSARAFFELRARFETWNEKQGRLADANERTLAALRSATIRQEATRNEELRQARHKRMQAHARETQARRRASERGCDAG